MEALLKVMPKSIKTGLIAMDDDERNNMQEIRLRVDKPLILKIRAQEYGLNERNG